MKYSRLELLNEFQRRKETERARRMNSIRQLSDEDLLEAITSGAVEVDQSSDATPSSQNKEAK